MKDNEHSRTFSKPIFVSGLLLMPLLLALVAGTASATSPGIILTIDLGTPEGPQALQAAGYQDCITLTTPCYDLVNPAQFSSDPNLFYGHQILFVGWTENAASPAIAALNARASDIANFVAAGGSIVALSEYSLGQFQWVPQGNQITLFQEHVNDMALTVAGAAHPIMAGQSSASLSGWGNSRHNYLTAFPSYLNVLATASNADKAVDLAGNYGAGCVALFGQDPDWHTVYSGTAAAQQLLVNTLAWATTCHCEDTPCEPRLMVRGTQHPRHITLDPTEPASHIGPIATPDRVGLSWVPVVDGPVYVPLPTGPITVDAGRILDSILPSVISIPATPIDDGTSVPYFYGTTTVTLKLCNCLVKGWSMSYVVVNDLPPLNDAINPIVTQTGPTTWSIHAGDYDTYRITFTVTLLCDGVVKTISTTYDQAN